MVHLRGSRTRREAHGSGQLGSGHLAPWPLRWLAREVEACEVDLLDWRIGGSKTGALVARVWASDIEVTL